MKEVGEYIRHNLTIVFAKNFPLHFSLNFMFHYSSVFLSYFTLHVKKG